MISANVTTRSENKVTRLRVADAAKEARRKTSTKKSPRRRKAKRRRAQQREQQRTVRTKALILEAALVEFAEKGFEGASIRDIGSRSGVPYPLITYHYRTKDMLWRAVAENAHAQLRQRWESVQSRDRGTGDCRPARIPQLPGSWDDSIEINGWKRMPGGTNRLLLADRGKNGVN